MLTKRILMFLAIGAVVAVLPLAGCSGGGEDNATEAAKAAKETDTQNPEEPKVKAEDNTMADDPKKMRGGTSGGGP
jgi:hypothetical protein